MTNSTIDLVPLAAKPAVSSSSVDFTPNPNRRHTRGRRGKILTGIADLQADFEADKDDRGGRRRTNLSLSRAKQARSDARHFAERGFRGKQHSERAQLRHLAESGFRKKPESKRGIERSQFVREKARARRVELGLEGRPRRETRRTRLARAGKTDAVFNLKGAVNQFRRTGKVPKVSVDVVRAAEVSGVDPKALKRMIQRMLVMGGIEENPGPPMYRGTPDVGVWVPKKISRTQSSSCSTTTAATSRIEEKKQAHGDTGTVGDAEQSERRRLWVKRRQRVGGLVEKELHRDADQQAAISVSANETAKEKAAIEEDAPVERSNVTDWSADGFVYRHGNFARRYAVDALSRGLESRPIVLLRRIWRGLRRQEAAEIKDPVSRIDNVFLPYDHARDALDLVSLSFRGFAAIFVAANLYYLVFAVLGIATFIAGYLGWLSWATTIPMWMVCVGSFVGLMFSLDERYAEGDWMMEAGPIQVHHVEADRDGDNRHPSSRDTKVTHQAVYAQYQLHLVYVRPIGNFLARGLMKLFGSWYVFWNYRSYFDVREVNETRTIDMVLAGHISTTLQTSAARGYDAVLEVAKVQAARIQTIQRPDSVHLRNDIVLDTVKWCAARACRIPREDFRQDAPLPY